jgi:hypothetical protein
MILLTGIYRKIYDNPTRILDSKLGSTSFLCLFCYQLNKNISECMYSVVAVLADGVGDMLP